MYPDESIQGIIDPHPWWETYQGDDYKRGCLVWAFLPHVDQTPFTLIPVGREEPTIHDKATVQIQPLNIRQVIRYPHLPVAALPQRHDEIRAVYLAKKRPALIISKGGPRVRKSLTKGKAKWQTYPTMIVAPYYGADEGGSRGGFNPQFLKRVRLCEYPQFMWDKLPISGRSTVESILRFDHMQPVGRSQDSIAFTDYCLSERALRLIDEWVTWLITGFLDESTKLREIRDVLLDIS